MAIEQDAMSNEEIIENYLFQGIRFTFLFSSPMSPTFIKKVQDLGSLGSQLNFVIFARKDSQQ